MSMMWPPPREYITSIPSAFRALATRWPPEISPGSTALLSGKVVASAAGVVVALTVGGLLGPVRRLVPAGYGALSVQGGDRAFHIVGPGPGGGRCVPHGRPGSVGGGGGAARRARCREPRAPR